MTSDLFFDTDCLSSFLWVKNENILLQLYPGRIVLPQPKGMPELAHLTKDLIKRDVKIDNSWGYDHGTWSVV
jgi:hypothetical protein